MYKELIKISNSNVAGNCIYRFLFTFVNDIGRQATVTGILRMQFDKRLKHNLF